MSEGAGWIESLLTESGALMDGHFLLSSGLHSPRYVQCARLLELPSRARLVGERLADRFRPLAPASVVAPAMGGLLIGHEVAEALDLPFRFTERKDGEMSLRRGFAFEPGERVVIVEDVVTTGKSTLETVSVIEAAGAEVVGVGSIIDRTSDEPFEVPYEALIALSFPVYEASSCPMCVDGSRPVKPGSRGAS